MGNLLRSSSIRRILGPLIWVLSLLLAGFIAGLLIYAWQQSKLRAAEEQNTELGRGLSDAQIRLIEQQSLAATLEVERVTLMSQLDTARADLADLRATPSAVPQPDIVVVPTEPPLCLGCAASANYLPRCVGYGSEEELRLAFSGGSRIDRELIESFFTDPTVTATWENGTLYEMCYSQGDKIAFVVYGEFEGFEGTNNLIGIYDGERLVAHRLFNRSSGDIGLCALRGYIESNVVYACGGGDGPGGWNTVYVMDHLTGESTTIMDCTYFEDESTCTVNLLGLPR